MHIVLVEVAKEVIRFARSARTQTQTLKSGCSPEYHQAQLRSPIGQAGEWGSSCTFLRHRQGDYSWSGSWDVSAKLPLSRDQTQGPYGTKGMPPLASQGEPSGDVLSSALQRFVLSGLHLNARNMKNTLKNKWVHVRPVSGNPVPDPSQSEAKASMCMSWSSDSSRYLSFRDKTVTHWIFKSFPWEPSALLSKHSALS